jgi:hypothetical protein
VFGFSYVFKEKSVFIKDIKKETRQIGYPSLGVL